ncbi:alpha/beta hydrolase [Nocardia sp. NPDC048505]|uniref:alpha/beta fold hydrolase n=1 Tax=unclassified Nocardia TaxID=2637762 RepID=UPI0033F6A583
MTDDIEVRGRLVPPVGGFREVGGRRVFAHRAGSRGPAVVFLPGASAVGLDYYGVQQGVSEFATAVIYDRGGTGYSDAVELPRSAEAVAVELREVLQELGIAGPYVLAAHSLGGIYAHRFAQLYPEEVAGFVWIDVVHRDWDEFMPVGARLAETERVGPGIEEMAAMRPALRAMHAELLAGYPEPVREALMAAKDSVEWMRSGIAERSCLAGLAAELRAGAEVPDVPMIALTAVSGVPEQRELEEGKRRMHAALVGRATWGEQRILLETEHHRVCFDRADEVVLAVREVIARA